MRICFGQARNGDHFATTLIPVLGGEVRLIARVSRAELAEMYRTHQCAPRGSGGEQIGFKFSMKSLGGAMKALAKPATLLKLTTMAARLSAGDPTALAMAPGLLAKVRAGMAAKRVMALATQGNPKAQAILSAARSAAGMVDAVAPSMSSSWSYGSDDDDGRQDEQGRISGIDPSVFKYLVTVQRLSQDN